MTGLNVFVPITKIDAAQRLVYGMATGEAPDRSGEVCDYASTKPHYEKWSGDIAKSTDGKSLGNLRAMHGKIAAGKVTSIAFNDAAKQIEICAKVVDDQEWRKVEEGVYTGFSQGGAYEKRWADPDDASLMRYTAIPSEISLVDLPCLPGATFQVIKEGGAVELRKFHTPAATTEPTNAEVFAKADELAKAAGGVAGDFIEAAREALVADLAKSAEKPVQADPTPTTQEGDVGTSLAKQDAPAVDPVAKEAPDYSGPVQKWHAKDGTAFAKKAEAVAHDAELDAKAEAAKLTHPATAALDALEDAMSKKAYTDEQRKKMAECGEAMSDGSFPVASKADLKNAVRACGRASDPEKAKAHIIERAKALGATDELPDGWVSKDDDAAKSFVIVLGDELIKTFGVSLAKWAGEEVMDSAQALQALNIIFNVLADEIGEGEDKTNPDQIAALRSAIDGIKAFIASEIAENNDPNDPANTLAMAAKAIDLAKRGARNSEADKKHIQAAHDHLKDLGAQCDADNCGDDKNGDSDNDGDSADKALETGALAKVAAERDALAKQLDDMTPRIEAMRKSFEERIAALEATPVPPPMLPGTRAVEKGGVDSEQSSNDLAEALAKLAQTDPQEAARLMIKISQANPKRLIGR